MFQMQNYRLLIVEEIILLCVNLDVILLTLIDFLIDVRTLQIALWQSD